VSEGITSVLSALGFLNPGLHSMQTLFILKLEQSSQLLRILLITCNFSFTSLWGIQSSQQRRQRQRFQMENDATIVPIFQSLEALAKESNQKRKKAEKVYF
jgi:hypothetical protein